MSTVPTMLPKEAQAKKKKPSTSHKKSFEWLVNVVQVIARTT